MASAARSRFPATPFGSTFQNNPPDGLRDTRVIFPFPAGPISIAEGETKSITMEGVRFSLSTPSIEPVDLNPKVLQVVGELNNGLGGNAFLIRFDDPLPFAPSTSELPLRPPSRQPIRGDTDSITRRPIWPSRLSLRPLWCRFFEVARALHASRSVPNSTSPLLRAELHTFRNGLVKRCAARGAR
jgi:hypothetical protein